MKSSLRPIPSFSSNVALICWIWLFNRTTSSSVQILSAYRITSAARRFSSICVSASNSATFSSSFCRYSATICGERSSTAETSCSRNVSFARISFFRFSPSVILVSTNCVKAPSSAFFSPFQSSSSSSTCSSIVRTSGNLASADTLMSFSSPNSSSICLKYFIYSAAINGLYFTELCACDRSSYVIKISTFPRFA